MRSALLLVAASLLAGCGDEQARDQASAAEERANSAYAMADEQRIQIEELEERLNRAGIE